MKLDKKRLYKINKILPILKTELCNATDKDYFDALTDVIAIISGEEPEISLLDVHRYVQAIETSINYFLYNTIDINKTNALVDCADIIREYKKLEPDYRLEE